MTIHSDYSPTSLHSGAAPADAPRRWAGTWSIRSASVVAGVSLLLMSVVAIFGNVFVVNGLVTEGDATQTAADIMAAAGLFRLGIASLIFVIALDVVVAWALYRVFSPVSKSLSMLAAAMRLVYSGVFMVAVAELVGVVRLLSNDAYRTAFDAEQVNAQALVGIGAFHDVWFVAQFLFGLHLLLIGYLAYRSGYVPRVLGGLLVISGLGYATDSLGAVLTQGAWTAISAFTFMGEFLLAIWLVIRARRIAASTSVLVDEQVALGR